MNNKIISLAGNYSENKTLIKFVVDAVGQLAYGFRAAFGLSTPQSEYAALKRCAKGEVSLESLPGHINLYSVTKGKARAIRSYVIKSILQDQKKYFKHDKASGRFVSSLIQLLRNALVKNPSQDIGIAFATALGLRKNFSPEETEIVKALATFEFDSLPAFNTMPSSLVPSIIKNDSILMGLVFRTRIAESTLVEAWPEIKQELEKYFIRDKHDYLIRKVGLKVLLEKAKSTVADKGRRRAITNLLTERPYHEFVTLNKSWEEDLVEYFGHAYTEWLAGYTVQQEDLKAVLAEKAAVLKQKVQELRRVIKEQVEKPITKYELTKRIESSVCDMFIRIFRSEHEPIIRAQAVQALAFIYLGRKAAGGEMARKHEVVSIFQESLWKNIREQEILAVFGQEDLTWQHFFHFDKKKNALERLKGKAVYYSFTEDTLQEIEKGTGERKKREELLKRLRKIMALNDVFNLQVNPEVIKKALYIAGLIEAYEEEDTMASITKAFFGENPGPRIKMDLSQFE